MINDKNLKILKIRGKMHQMKKLRIQFVKIKKKNEIKSTIKPKCFLKN